MPQQRKKEESERLRGERDQMAIYGIFDNCLQFHSHAAKKDSIDEGRSRSSTFWNDQPWPTISRKSQFKAIILRLQKLQAIYCYNS